MASLHTVNKSPFSINSLKSCLEHANDGDTILLIEDGIYGALKGSEISQIVADKIGSLSIIALEPDMKARGIDSSKILTGIITTNYDGFVELAAKHDVCQAWL